MIMQSTIAWLDITEVQPPCGAKVLFVCDENIHTGWIAYAESDKKPVNPVDWCWEDYNEMMQYWGVRYWAEFPELP
jgi:hypothetical protein